MTECRQKAELAMIQKKPNWLAAGVIIAIWIILAVVTVWLVLQVIRDK